MDWLIIIVVLWLVSSHLFSKSNFRFSKKDSTESLNDMEMESSNYRKREESVIGTNPMIFVNHRLYGQFMSKEAKRQYLTSSKWNAKRNLVLARDNYNCQSCGTTELLECHHIDYSELGNEPLEHLVTVCRTCHQSIHDRLGYDRTTIFNIKGLTCVK